MISEVNGILVAAHDLKAPLALMRQLALTLQLTDDEKIQDRLCGQMVSISERALRQVNDLAKIARLEDGFFTMEPVSVRGVCEMVSRDVSNLFSYDHKALTIKYRNRERLVIANQDLLYSVIYNFCTNALHYSHQDTTSIMTVSDDHQKIRVNVRDFGPALPASVWREIKAGKIKQPLSISMRPGSSGLGLFIASQFANYMHANLGATRHRDGTSFFVDLPISKQGCFFL